MRLRFDRGTVVLHDLPAPVDASDLPGVLWDPRVSCFRAPARATTALTEELRRRGVPVLDEPRPTLAQPAGFAAIPLRPYQEAALAAWRLAGGRGLVALPTGSGKTHVALAAIASAATPTLILVPTRALMQQWHAAIAAVYAGPVGLLGDGERALTSITVATFASAYHHMPELGDRFGLLVVDEAHHFGGGRHDEALELSIAALRLGLSATPPSPGEAASRLALLVGPTVFELDVAALAGTFLAPFDRVTWRVPLAPDERQDYDALVAVYRRVFRIFQGGRLGATWEDFLRDAGRTDEGRTALAAWRRASRLLAYPRGKRAALAQLLARHRQHKTLIFVANNETAYAVATEHLVMPLTCDIGRAERQSALDRFRAGELRALVSAQVLNEGLDVPDAEVGIVVAGRRGEREHVQRVGRLLRPGPGKRALVYELVVANSSEARQAARRWERLAG